MSNATPSLGNVRLLSGVDEHEIEKLDRACAWKRYTEHEQIIDRQSDSRDVYFVIEGSVRVVNYSLSGKDITLDDLGEGSHFGELAAIDRQPRSASVMALDDCLLAAMPPDRFLEFIESHPAISLRLMRSMAQIIRASNERIMDLSTLAANNRVQAELLRQAMENEVDGNSARISPIPVHGDIASRVSTTRETVARVLSDLSRQGIVKRRKSSLAIMDLKQLREMVEEVRGE